jgi:hypothetical protein
MDDLTQLVRAAGYRGGPALVLTCGTEAAALSRLMRVSCLSAPSDDDVPAGVRVLSRLPPRSELFGLLVVPSAYWHAQAHPYVALRRLRSRIARDTPALIFCESAVGHLGLSHVVVALRALLDAGSTLRDPLRLQLAFSLLQSLPRTNAFVRNAALRHSLDLSDIATLETRLLEPAERAHAPSAPLLAHVFARQLCRGGMRVLHLRRIRAPPPHANAHADVDTNDVNTDTTNPDTASAPARLDVALGGSSRLLALSRDLPWLHRAQLSELFFGDTLLHVAIARVGAPPSPLIRGALRAAASSVPHHMQPACSTGVLTELAALQHALSGLEEAMGAQPPTDEYATLSTTSAASASAAASSTTSTTASSSTASASTPASFSSLPSGDDDAGGGGQSRHGRVSSSTSVMADVAAMYEALPFPPRRMLLQPPPRALSYSAIDTRPIDQHLTPILIAPSPRAHSASTTYPFSLRLHHARRRRR